MKKTILSLIIMLMLVSEGICKIYGKIEIGMPFGPDCTFKLDGEETEFYTDTYFTNLMLGWKDYTIWNIEYRVFCGIFTWADIDGISGKPFEEVYGLGGRLKYDGIYIQVNHFCAHPVINHTEDTENRRGQITKYNEYVPDGKSYLTKFQTLTLGYEFEL